MYELKMLCLGQNFIISWFTNPPTVIFQKEEKKSILKIIFLFYQPTPNINCFFEKKRYIFEVLSVSFWEWHC